ncbi:MAG: metallophosphoesterase family protein [Alphaproteobacteria bacterium]|nr:metallophosphoesterase family protein [Alphaproteobacteria bacterium]
MAADRAPLLEPVADLGPVDGPLIVFGGPLGNLDALDALMESAKREGIAPRQMLSTGDTVAYCADPAACAARLRDAGIHVVMGNCEEAVAAGAEDCGCDFVTGSACDLLAAEWYGFARSQIGADLRAWMETLPRRLVFTMGGTRFAVIHGGARRINRYLFASDRVGLTEETAALGADVVIAGHAGLPFTTDIGDRLWHNPGALGLPANDGTPRVWYGHISCAAGVIAIAHRALDYDHRAQAEKMRAAGLPEAYARALETGLWPDTAILPEAETEATGTALGPLAITWKAPVAAERVNP